MITPEEKLNEVQKRFNQNVAQAQQIEQQIAKLQEQLRTLQQPLVEDQGAIKALKEIVEPIEQTTFEAK
tara:strand:- start:463 stop:669 length:207 start_codon:yes stop_codon:yes gene_type:complete